MDRFLNKNNKGILLDGCGNDERLYQMGLYTDLCGMSIEDYINSTKCNCGGLPNTPEEPDEPMEPVKILNTITVSISSEGNLIAYLNYAPTVDITFSCICEGKDLLFTFLANNNDIVVSEHIVTGETISLSNVTITPNEDEKYKYGDYTIVKPSKNTNIFVPNFEIRFNELEDILKTTTKENLVRYEVSEDGTIIDFSHDLIEVPEDVITDEEYYEWLKANSFVPILYIEKEKFDNKIISIYIGNNDRTEAFIEIATANINGLLYSAIANYTNDPQDIATKLEYKENVFLIVHPGDNSDTIRYIIKE